MLGLNKILTKEIILKKEQDRINYLTYFTETASNSKVKKVKFYGFHSNEDFFAFSLDYDKGGVRCQKTYQRLSMHLNIRHNKINKKSDMIFVLKEKKFLYFFIILFSISLKGFFSSVGIIILQPSPANLLIKSPHQFKT